MKKRDWFAGEIESGAVVAEPIGRPQENKRDEGDDISPSVLHSEKIVLGGFGFDQLPHGGNHPWSGIICLLICDKLRGY